MADSSWRVTVPPGAAVLLHRRTGHPSMLAAINGFWATLHAEPGQLRLVHGEDKTIAAISPIEEVVAELADNGYGTWLPAVVITTGGAKFAVMPFERPGLLPHTVKDPSAIAASIRAVVFTAGRG